MDLDKSIISSDLLKLAKLKGFNYEQRIITSLNYLNNDYEHDIHGVTQSLLQKWLREEHKIHISIWFNRLTEKFRIDSIYSEINDYELEKEGSIEYMKKLLNKD